MHESDSWCVACVWRGIDPNNDHGAHPTVSGDVDEAEVGLPGIDFELEEEEVEETGIKPSTKGGASRQGRSSKPQETYVVPFQPDQSTVRKVPQMRKVISDWILSSIAALHGHVRWSIVGDLLVLI